MKTIFFTLSLLLSVTILFAQSNSQSWNEIQKHKSMTGFSEVSNLFSWHSDLPTEQEDVLSEGALVTLNANLLKELVENRAEAISIEIPLSNKTNIQVELIQKQRLDPGFNVGLASEDAGAAEYSPGVYYSGSVAGDPQSWAAISLFDNEIMGVISSGRHGTLTIGDYEDEDPSTYVIFAAEDFKKNLPFECGVEGLEEREDEGKPSGTEAALDSNKCVRIYFECEYHMYQSRGSSISSTVNYMTGIYNVVATLYDNEFINTVISEIFVWNTPDSYATNSTSSALSSFRTARPSFNGDLAHLVSRGAPSGGGVAWVDALCSSYRYAYSYIYSSYSAFPTYSWTVNVIAHEMGHNLGSWHTHDCKWDVNNDGFAVEPIDGCGPTAGYSGAGACQTASLPTNGGTVMSYCHLLSAVRINPINGFGLLPGNEIRDKVYNASCLSACSSCLTQLASSQSNVSCNGQATGSATVTASGGTPPYTYSWSNGANTAAINGLSAGQYIVTVTDDNGNGCAVNDTVVITQPSAISLSFSSINETNPGDNDGSIDLTVSGGSPPYTYSWSNGSTNQDLTGLSAGVYTVTVTDNNACVSVDSTIVGTVNSCSSTISSFPYSESFESGLGLWIQETNDNFNWTRKKNSTPTNKTGPTSAKDGIWYLFIEASGNRGEAHLTSPCLNLSAVAGADLDFAYHMYGRTMGTLSVQVSTDFGASWSTLWTRSGNKGQNWKAGTVSLNAYLGPNTQIRFVGLRGTGGKSDMAIDNISVTTSSPPCTAPTLNMSHSNLTCHGSNNGTAAVLASGASQPYSYAWSNGNTSPNLTGLIPGTYIVTVTDALGCVSVDSVIISEPASISMSFTSTPESSPGASDGSINLTHQNGIAPFSYLWSNGSTTMNLTSIGAGVYTVSITDSASCTAVDSTTVNVQSSCGTSVSAPYTESFESGLGLWTQDNADDFDWKRKSGSTGTASTGPSSASDGTWYLYIEANNKSKGDFARLNSPCIDLRTASNPEFVFDYHMYGNQMGSLKLDLSTDNGSTWIALWSDRGNRWNRWRTQSVDLSSYTGLNVMLRFTGVRGKGVRSDAAIDNIRLQESSVLPAQYPELQIYEHELQWTALYPNPSTGKVSLEFTSNQEEIGQISLVDLLGRTSTLEKFSIVKGFNILELDLSDQQPGLYIVILQTRSSRIDRRLILNSSR